MEIVNKKEDIIWLIKLIDKEFKADFSARLSKYGLTAQQGRLLFYIKFNHLHGNEIRQVDIEKHFQLTKSTVSGLINRMEKANLIYKVKENQKQYIRISEQCENILDDVFSQRTECINKVTKGMSEEEVETLVTLLNKVLNNSKGGDDKCSKQ